MILKINCEYNDDGAWCTNKKVRRSLFGLGSRCCSEYNDKKCDKKITISKSTSPPPNVNRI